MNPFFFLHIPRTGGTTVDSVLLRAFKDNEVIRVYSKNEYALHREHTLSELENIKLITGHLLLESVSPPKIYGIPVRAFTFLREPVARLYSEYSFLRTWKENHLFKYLNENKITFSEYLMSKESFLFYRGKNFMTRCLSGESFGDEACPHAALEKAKKNLENSFEFFGIQERFLESMLLLGDKIGIQDLLHLRRNAIKANKFGSKISLEEKKLALSLNEADSKLYAYAFDLFERRIHELGKSFLTRLNTFTILNQKYQKISDLLYRREIRQNDTEDISLPKETFW